MQLTLAMIVPGNRDRPAMGAGMDPRRGVALALLRSVATEGLRLFLRP